MTDEHREWQKRRLDISRHDVQGPVFHDKECDLDPESYGEKKSISFSPFKTQLGKHFVPTLKILLCDILIQSVKKIHLGLLSSNSHAVKWKQYSISP